MKKFKILFIIIIVLTSVLNYGCEHLCGDEDSPRVQKEASYQKVDTLNTSHID